MYEYIIVQGILGELNKEHESFLKDKKDGEVAAVPPWIGHPNEEAVKAECLTLSTVSIVYYTYTLICIFTHIFIFRLKYVYYNIGVLYYLCVMK